MEDVKLCRLCAGEKHNFVGIYDEEGHKLNLESKIEKCLQIQLLNTDVLPKCICLECCAKLNQCAEFCEATSQAQLTLHMIYAEPKKEEMDVVEREIEVDTECLRAPELEGVEDEYEYGSSLEEEEEDEEDEEDEEEGVEEEELDYEEEKLNVLNADTPDYLECVLSGDASKDSPSISKRKCRVPVRLVAGKDEGDDGDVASKERKAMLVNRAVAATSHDNDDGAGKKKRDGWEKYPWLCTDCDKEMPSMQMLRTHHNTVHGQQARFMCAECSKVYNKYYGFVSHVRRHRNFMKFGCEECGKAFSNKKVLESHRATHSDARPFVCSECGKSFRQQSALYVHNRSHQPDDVKNKYPCDQCDKRFSTKPNLVTHKRIHTGIRNYTCDQCGKSFIQKGNLDAHLLTHSHEKPHSCPICNKGFKTPLQLRKHHTVHTGAKPHQCDVCGRQFRERGTLREHHRIHTGAMPFTCEFCGKNFRFKGILTTHRRQHTGERPYSCIECQHHFTNWPNYNKHMKRRHGINTSHQPDPNKIAREAQKALLANQPSPPPPPILGTSSQLLSSQAYAGEDGQQFYSPGNQQGANYAAPPMGSMLYYNLPQLQQTMEQGLAMDMLQHR